MPPLIKDTNMDNKHYDLSDYPIDQQTVGGRVEPVVSMDYYVQLAPRATLVKRRVLDVTDKTILLEDNEKVAKTNYDKSRYKRSDIEIVESC